MILRGERSIHFGRAIFIRFFRSLPALLPSATEAQPGSWLKDSGQNKFILGASWTVQSKPAELQDALEVRKPHLDLLALAPRLLEVLGANERSGDVAGMLMDITRDLA
jgi:hypothetical protein